MKIYMRVVFLTVLLLCPLLLQAEGTKQWTPTASENTYLKVNSTGNYSFAGYGVPANKRLHIHIDNPLSEVVYLGFSNMVNEPANVDLTTPYTFQIRSPSGAVVHGPFSVTSPNITSHAMAAAGPDALAAGGYPVGGNAMWTFNPTDSGDHYIEFATAGSIRWFDITVANSTLSTAIDGRVWSQAWAVRADNGYTGLANAFDTPFTGKFVAYDGEFATQIDFAGSGIRPLEGQFSFNQTGPGSTGNIENDRRSVDGSNATNPFHKIFLNQPDPAVYPLSPKGVLQNLPLIVVNPANPVIELDVTRPGQIEIVMDFGSNIRRLFADVVGGVNQIPWDGKDGNGVTVQINDYPVPVDISYTQGITHFTAYDVEGLDNGFEIYTQTATGLEGPNQQYWDDTNIPDAPGTSDVQANVDAGASTRRRWNQNNYGDLNTINTWWYAYQGVHSSTIVAPGDYGDAPDSYEGAFHVDPANTPVYLGTQPPDENTDSLNTARGGTDGEGDDLDGTDDEDGINSLPPLTTLTTSYTLPASDISVVNTSGGDATLYAFIDFNNNGNFNDAGESVSVNVGAGATQPDADLVFTGFTMAAVAGTTYARFRISTQTGVGPDWVAADGEVEDYALPITEGVPLAPFVCDGTPYNVIGTPSVLQSVDGKTLTMTDLGNIDPAIRINGIAYNALDDFIYGYFSNDAGAGSGIANNSIIRIGSGRLLEDLGVPSGSSAFSPATHIGTMDNAGRFYGLSSTELYIVDIGNAPSANSLTFITVPLSGVSGTPNDITFSTYDDAIYGVRSGQLVRITTAGVGSTVATTGDALPSAAGGAWSSADGSLYFYNNGGGTLHKVDLTQPTPVAALVGSVAQNGQFDSAACTPPTLKKAASVTHILPGQSYTYTYTISNAFTFPIPVSFADTLPGDIVYDTATLSDNSPGGGSVATFNATTLQINNITVPANSQISFNVTVDVDASIAIEKNIDNQAVLTYGLANFDSDDPNTAAIDDPTRVVVTPVDYGDAPATYDAAGATRHGLSPGIFLGAIAPDTDNNAQNTANGGSDGVGDDTDGTDDEEGVRLNGTTLQDQTLNNGSAATLTITTNGSARLHGWIDWDGNGVFGNNANELIISEPTNGSGTRNISVTPPNNLTPGTSYARFRYSTDAAAANPTGTASDGEVEDYRLTLSRGFSVSGRVFKDTDVDGVNDTTEAGVTDLPVVLYDVTNNTCISTRTNANGEYTFSNIMTGNYQVYEASRESVPTPQNCGTGFARDPGGYLSTTANVSATLTLSNASINGIDFGDIKPPLFELDNSQSILPNTTAIHPHIFTAQTDGSVSFSVSAENAEPNTVAWSSQLLQDVNCDGLPNGGDIALPVSISVNAGDQVCIFAKVLAPANVTTGAVHTLEIQSNFTYGDGSSGLANDIQTHQDITQSLAGTTTAPPTNPTVDPVGTPDPVGGESKLSLVKSVWNVTRNIDGAVALPGETLRYTISYENIGNGPLNELIIHDSVPEFTELVPASMLCTDTPPELPACTINANPNGDLSWSWTSADKLQPGSKGSVSYQVLIE